MRLSRREIAYNIFWFVWASTLVVIIVLAFAGSIQVDQVNMGGGEFEKLTQTMLRNIQASNRIVIPVLTAVLMLSRLLSQQIGAGWIWRTIESLLTEYRLHGFTKAALEENEYYHRVTLFQYVTWSHWWIWITPQVWRCCWRLWPNPFRWPGSGWLIVVRRSGNATKRTDVVFLACDDADQAEGIAAQAFLGNQVFTVTDLPNLDGTHSDADIDEYAKNTYVSVEWVRKRLKKQKQRSRSLVAIPVEVDNKPWGVLLLDSRATDGIKPKNKTCDVIIAIIGKLLKGR